MAKKKYKKNLASNCAWEMENDVFSRKFQSNMSTISSFKYVDQIGDGWILHPVSLSLVL